MSFDRLIRYIDDQGRTLYGNLDEALPYHEIIGREVQVVSGSLEDGFTKSSQKARVSKVGL